MPHNPDVIDLADDDDNDEAEYDSIPLPDDIEAIENGRHTTTEENQSGIDIRQSLKEELAKLEAEVSICYEAKTETFAAQWRHKRDRCPSKASRRVDSRKEEDRGQDRFSRSKGEEAIAQHCVKLDLG